MVLIIFISPYFLYTYCDFLLSPNPTKYHQIYLQNTDACHEHHPKTGPIMENVVQTQSGR